MLKIVQTIEDWLVRLETGALVLVVMAMLLLAGYNVLYRNALTPLQTYLRHTGPLVDTTGAEQPAADGDEGSAGDEGDEDGEDAEGFRGGFGGGSEKEDGSDDAEGFVGGFGGGGDKAGSGGVGGGESGASDDAEGFVGGFGGGEDDKSEGDGTDDEKGSEGFVGGFGGGGSPSDDKSGDGDGSASGETGGGSRAETEEKPQLERVPPAEGTWARWGIQVIDAIKLSWIDLFLRQMVLVVGFLGAMLAARRREHITIDAVGQLIQGRHRAMLDAVTSLFAAVACGFLALAGAMKVTAIWEEGEMLLPWAEEWVFRMMFPVGFGMIALHFVLRALESGWLAAEGEGLEVEEKAGGAETAETAESGAPTEGGER